MWRIEGSVGQHLHIGRIEQNDAKREWYWGESCDNLVGW